MKFCMNSGLWCAAMVLGASGIASGADRGALPVEYDLIGIDAVGDLYRIDTETGSTTLLLDRPEGSLGGPLAYEPASGKLGIILGTNEPGDLLLIDPVTAAVEGPFPITGLPAGQLKTGGIGYLGGSGGFVVTFGPSNTFLEDKLAQVGTDGVVVQTSDPLGLGDNDGCFWDFVNGYLIVNDYNANDGLARVASVEDIFTTPVITDLASPPIDGTMGDSASHPVTGQIFITRFIGSSGELVELVGDSYDFIGAYDSPEQIVGIAFVPSVPCPADVTGDGGVDLADLNLVLANFGQATGDGDATGDGEVDLADLNAVLGAFGVGCG